MLISRSINNNVVLATDEGGREVILFGKGLGFHSMPYELLDESRIQRRFYEVDSSLLPMVETLPADVLAASAEIVDLARSQLSCKLNPNLSFTLADHIRFAIQCANDNVVIENPLAPEISVVYPRETQIGLQGIEIVRRNCGVTLPQTEGYAMAVHIVSGETAGSAGSSMDVVMKSTHIINEIVSLVERDLGTKIDRTAYSYTRFVTHLRFLVSRFMSHESLKGSSDGSTERLLNSISAEYPAAAHCARSIKEFLLASCGWDCSDEELLYLMLHTNQFITDL